jgi:hypothetical protein
MSVVGMQTSVIRNRHCDCQLLEPVARRVSIGGIVDHFQQALIGLDLFGPGICALTIGSGLLISLFQHVEQYFGTKGVI